jgi:predicted  nucleic acid-binding Zn-ribbon protein
MNYKSIQEYEKDLKDAKKRYDKMSKQIRKCKSDYQYEMMCEDMEDCRQDIVELQLIIKDLRQQKKLAELEVG